MQKMTKTCVSRKEASKFSLCRRRGARWRRRGRGARAGRRLAPPPRRAAGHASPAARSVAALGVRGLGARRLSGRGTSPDEEQQEGGGGGAGGWAPRGRGAGASAGWLRRAASPPPGNRRARPLPVASARGRVGDWRLAAPRRLPPAPPRAGGGCGRESGTRGGTVEVSL